MPDRRYPWDIVIVSALATMALMLVILTQGSPDDPIMVVLPWTLALYVVPTVVFGALAWRDRMSWPVVVAASLVFTPLGGPVAYLVLRAARRERRPAA